MQNPGEIRNLSPVDFRPLPPTRVSTDDEVSAAVQSARIAQPGWATIPFKTRVKLLKKAAKQMIARREEAVEFLHAEAGKTPAESLMSEALGPLQYVTDWAAVIRPHLGAKKVPISRLAFPGKSATVEQVPRGVMAIISPWNYPMGNYFKPLFPALLSGNSVVIKPSEYSPLTAIWFVSILNEFLPPGVLQLVQGDKAVGQKLLRAGIDAVTFTGSFYSGREVAKVAAEQMIPCSVELGGKDAAIVLADCDLDRTVAGIMHWALHNAGQACGAIDRVYVEEAIADRFVSKLSQAVSKLRADSGDPQTSDIGPLVHDLQLSVVEDHIADAVQKGAKIACGGKRTGKGRWHEPTVLDNCNHTMKVCTEPTFGPVIPIVRVQDGDQGVALANDSTYGLNGSVWSGDRKRASELASKLYVGTAFINNHAFTGAIAAAPWTGVKQTGYGVANSSFALAHYTRPRTQVMDRGTACDSWWFPVNGTLEELGQRLGDAQVGKLLSAIRIPFLISRRQKQVLRFVQSGGQDTGRDLDPTPGPSNRQDKPQPVELNKATVARFFARTALILSRSLRWPLTSWERRWAETYFDTVFPTPADKTLAPIAEGQIARQLNEMILVLPLTAAIGLRLSVWAAGLAPIPALWRVTSIDRLSFEDRLKVAVALSKNNSYLVRQMNILLKTFGGLSYASTSRFKSLLRPRPQLDVTSASVSAPVTASATVKATAVDLSSAASNAPRSVLDLDQTLLEV